jgi:hypothetical protein
VGTPFGEWRSQVTSLAPKDREVTPAKWKVVSQSEFQVPTEAVRKLGEILQTIEQSKIFRDFFDSGRSKTSQKRTKQARVKTRKSFHTCLDPKATFKVGLMNGQ